MFRRRPNRKKEKPYKDPTALHNQRAASAQVGSGPTQALVPIPLANAQTASGISAALQRSWGRCTPQQKVIYAILLLIAAGVSSYAIYQLLPFLVHSAQNHPRLIQKTTLPSEHQLSRKSSMFFSNQIRCEPNLRAELASRPEGSHLLPLVDKLVLKIRRVIHHVVQPQLLAKVFTDPNFRIELVGVNDPQLVGFDPMAPTARYIPVENRVLIGLDTDYTQEELIVILRNEFHHAIMRSTNYNRQINPNDSLPTGKQAFNLIYPFMRDRWQQDPELKKQHQAVIERGLQRAHDFKLLFSTNLISDQSIVQYLQALAHYTPRVYQENMSRDQSNQILQQLPKTPEGKYVAEIPGKSTYYIHDVAIHEMEVAIRYTFAKDDFPASKARAFLEDMTSVKNAMSKGYAHLDDTVQAMELSSFIEELDAEVKKAFFPEWCDYFSQYTQVDDYCQPIPMLTKGPKQ